MPSLTRLVLLFLVLAAMRSSLYSQARAPADVSASITAIAWFNNTGGSAGDVGLPSELYFLGSNGYQRLDYQVRQIGSVQHYRGPRHFTLYTRQRSLDNEWLYTSVAGCDIGDGGEVMLFLFGDDERVRFDLYPVNLSLNKVKDGDMAIINLTRFPIAVAIHSTPEGIQPGRYETFDTASTKAEADVPIKIALYDEGWHMAYNVSTVITPDRPYLGVFYLKDNKAGAYRFRLFRELDVLRTASARAASLRADHAARQAKTAAKD